MRLRQSEKSKRMKENKMDCNRDCFNCPFDDCIQEDITDSEIASIESRNKKCNVNKSADYLKRREKILAERKRYYRKHSEERKQYQLERYHRLRDNQEANTCNRCFRPLEEGNTHKLCDACREKKRVYQNMKYRQKAM